MSVYRVIDVIGTSTQSWEDAAVTAVNTARKSLRDLRVAEVVQQDLRHRGWRHRFPDQAAAVLQVRGPGLASRSASPPWSSWLADRPGRAGRDHGVLPVPTIAVVHALNLTIGVRAVCPLKLGSVHPHRDPAGPVLRAPKTAELIASYIRGQVVRGDLKTGDSLPPETVLMEMFGVSRPTLREAFRILEAESLISVRRGARGGARVVSPDIAVAARYVGLLLQMSGTTIADVYEARMATEPAAAGLLAAGAPSRTWTT